MAIIDIIKKFKLNKVNPFQGLTIDADTWRDEHSYHRSHQRLHTLAFHGTGILEGFEVTTNRPADLSVNIQPGLAVDPEGNVVIVPQIQHYRLQTSKSGTIYLIIQFREVPDGPYQPPKGGQPTRLLDAYKIEERDKLPTEPHIELARIHFDPADEAIRDAKTPSHAGKNEIDLSFRKEVVSATVPVAPERPPVTTPEIVAPPREMVTVGDAALGGASASLHFAGLNKLLGEMNQQYSCMTNLEENVALDKNLSRYTMLYLTGNSHFELAPEQEATVSDFLQSGGVIFGEGCSEGRGEAEARGAKEFGLAFNQLAGQVKCKLETVQRGHPLLFLRHVFSEVPQGVEPGMLLEGGHMIYSGSGYGCAWQGGHEDAPLPREIIRSAFEMGANIFAYAQNVRAGP
ncbi:DUF4159 domain-containing protein [Chloroflexota bacterium]